MGKKQEELDEIDELVRTKMLDCLNNNKTELLTELSVVVGYLAKNNVVSEKGKSSVEDNTKKKLADAKKRREEEDEF